MHGLVEMVDLFRVEIAYELGQLWPDDVLHDASWDFRGWLDIVFHFKKYFENELEGCLIDGCDFNASMLDGFGFLHVLNQFLLCLVYVILFAWDRDNDHVCLMADDVFCYRLGDDRVYLAMGWYWFLYKGVNDVLNI